MKKLSLLVLFVALAAVLSSTPATASDFRYVCEVWKSDNPNASRESTVLVDSGGKFLVYQDAYNDCNGTRDFKSAKGQILYRTDCEWDGFVDVVLTQDLIDGKSAGEIRLRNRGKRLHQSVYRCTLAQGGVQ